MRNKLTSIILAAVMLITLAACSAESPAVMTYGDSCITEAMYTYYVSTYKGRYIQAYSDITDTEEFWNKDFGGKTGEEVMRELIYGNVAQNLVASAEYRKAGMSLPADEAEAVDSYISSMTEELASGSRKTLNGYLSEFGVNVEILREMLLMESEAQAYYEYLYGENGAEAIDDGDREEYYGENYVRFQQIYINNIQVYEKDDDGYYVQDENGNFVTRDLTAEEKAEAEAKINAVKDGLESGDDFDRLKEEYSDSTDYDRGYYFSAATSTNYITAVVSAAFALGEGEWTYVEAAAENGAFFIKRLPLEDGAYKDEELSDFFEDFDEALTSEQFSQKMEELCEGIVSDEAFMDSVSVKDAPANYYYY